MPLFCPSPKALSPTCPSALRRWSAPRSLGRRIGAEQPLRQERLRLLPHALLQGPRRLRRPRQRAEVRLHHRRLLLHRQPRQLGRRAGRAPGPARPRILIPADLEPAKILNTLVYGARLVRIDGNYDHVNRLCTLIADEYSWGFVNVNLRPYYAEGSKTQGYEIAEQLGWRLPDNVVCPMAGGSLIRKIRKAFNELICARPG